MRTVAVFLAFLVARATGTVRVCPTDSLTELASGIEVPTRIQQCPNGVAPEASTCADADYIDGDWSTWTEWIRSTYATGGSYVTRTRTCTNPVPDTHCDGKKCRGKASEVQACSSATAEKRNGHWTAWTDWSRFETPRGSPGVTRTRMCSDPPPDCGGDKCDGADYEVKVCVDCAPEDDGPENA